MVKTVLRKRIEVIVDKPLLDRLEKIANQAGVKYYTVLPTRAGGDEQGRWYDDRVTGGAGTKVVYSAVMSEDVADKLVAALEPLLEPYRLVLFRSDVEVLRADKF